MPHQDGNNPNYYLYHEATDGTQHYYICADEKLNNINKHFIPLFYSPEPPQTQPTSRPIYGLYALIAITTVLSMANIIALSAQITLTAVAMLVVLTYQNTKRTKWLRSLDQREYLTNYLDIPQEFLDNLCGYEKSAQNLCHVINHHLKHMDVDTSEELIRNFRFAEQNYYVTESIDTFNKTYGDILTKFDNHHPGQKSMIHGEFI